TSENTLQLILALVAITPGVIALYVQWRKNIREANDAERDDNRDDFAALFDAAKQLGDAGTSLIEPLNSTIKSLQAEMKKRDQEHRKELMDIELRLSAAERQIEELVKVNQKLSDANQRYENFIKWIKGELSRLANVEP
ncbi:MAG: hypothetical protein GWO23_08965, partial [Gammaproteobacteria bacterium]|nr:hypothetical protein [Phycisphaerae bacterium]NIQ09792.1 hypothetical protein [Gammaproteobacteria bacterium]NIX27839.1 hypothetical protein [Phycisphaerae bacterium]